MAHQLLELGLVQELEQELARRLPLAVLRGLVLGETHDAVLCYHC